MKLAYEAHGKCNDYDFMLQEMPVQNETPKEMIVPNKCLGGNTDMTERSRDFTHSPKNNGQVNTTCGHEKMTGHFNGILCHAENLRIQCNIVVTTFLFYVITTIFHSTLEV